MRAGASIDGLGTFEQGLEAWPGAMLIVDRDGTIVAVNRALERQFGHARDALVGRGIDLIVPDAPPLIEAAISERLAAETSDPAPAPVAHRAFGHRQDGSRFPVEIGLNPIQTATDWIAIASIMDATERRRLDEAYQSEGAELLKLERLIAQLSAQFINLPADQIDDATQTGLRQTCELLGLDRATFIRIGPEGTLLAPLRWHAPGVPPLDQVDAEQFPWTIERVLAGELVSFSTRDEVPNDIDRASYEALGTQSATWVPLAIEDHVTAILGFSSVHAVRTWPPELLHHFRLIAGVFAQALARQQKDEALQAAIEEAQHLKSQLHVENVYLRQEARQRLTDSDIVGQSAALRQVLAQIEQVAPTDSTVLLLGETGTGKELLATHIHALSARRGRPMVRVNCAAIPATLIESELFGREKGAFTGALSRQVGRFELADHSSIFLDEIGDLPADIQVKLLRVLEERKFERLGNPRSIGVDTRVIAATHRNLEQRIAEGGFREDLYYRLNVFPIHVPALRDRPEDIPRLVSRFVEEFSRSLGKRIEVIDRESLTALQGYSWPGNIRELRNVVERAMIVTTSRRLTIVLPESPSSVSAKHSPKLIDIEKDHILAVLESAAWRIRGAGGAANRLGMKPTTLETRMAKLGLRRPRSATS